MSRALIIVNYRSAELTRDAIASARRTSSQSIEVIVVDNSVDPQEAACLGEIGADRVLISPNNSGYAAGLNAGIAATTADQLLLSNPDIVFFDQCIDKLFASTESNDGIIAGPRFYWDAAASVILPEPDEPTPTAKRVEMLARRHSLLARARDRRRVRRRIRFWSSSEVTRPRVLSGAVLALSRRTFERLGPLDETFRLYFEEVDYCRRARENGVSLLHLSEARCRHLYNQSALSEPSSASLYLESEIRYFNKWFGERIVEEIARRGSSSVSSGVEVGSRIDDGVVQLDGDPTALVLEVSPDARFAAAAGLFPSAVRIEIPLDVRQSMSGQPLYIRAVDRRSGAERGRWWCPPVSLQ